MRNPGPRRAAERELREETGYEAPGWKYLGYVTPNPALQNNRCVQHEYCAYGGVCQHCDLRAKCLSPKAKRRSLLIAPHEELAAAMRARVATEEGQAALQRRKETVEPRFGVLKSVQNLRQLLLRGLAGAEIEFGLSAIGLNVRILTAWALTGGAVGQLAQATS